MLFSEIIGQETLKSRLIQMQDSGRAPHALLFCGGEGRGKLALALAYAQRLCCEHPTESDSCGVCPSCLRFAKLRHPDLHLEFPLVKPEKAKDSPLCSEFLETFADTVIENPYISIDEWSAQISDGKVARYYDRESDEIIRQVNMKSFIAKYKTIVIWCPERMDETSSNHLLKIIEEPPSDTVFLLVSDVPQKIIGTILSRLQHINVPPIDDESLYAALKEQNPELNDDQCNYLIRNAHGSWSAVQNGLNEDNEEDEFFTEFQTLMRMSYRPIILDVKAWTEAIGSRKRTWVVTFLQNAQRLVRENFIYNMQMKEITYMNTNEEQFSSRFARFIHQNNIEGITNELALAQAQIEQNASMKIVMFDVVLKLYNLLNRQAPVK